MKIIVERSLTEPRLRCPWGLDIREEASIRRSLPSYAGMSLQRLDYLQGRDGVFHLVAVEINPVTDVPACSLVQKHWFEDQTRNGHLTASCDQFNVISQILTQRLGEFGERGSRVHVFFDVSDRASVAMAAYATRIGINARTEIILIGPEDVSRPEGIAVDRNGDAILLCWDCTPSGDRAKRRIDMFSATHSMTPAWHYLLPDAFLKMGEFADVAVEHQKKHFAGLTVRVSVWLVDQTAAAISCSAVEPDSIDTPKGIAHVIR